MDRTYIAENDEERKRLADLLGHLSDEDLAKPLGEHWTVGVGLMHLAFWDRMWLSKFEEWERTDAVEFPPLRGVVLEVNDAILPWWQSISTVQVRHEALAAAQAIDDKAASLSDDLVAAILADRPRTLSRAVHRREHLDEIAAALAP
jgi:uncharacterized damage-inducible protein DinB